MNRYLKQCSKKKSTFEAVTGTTFKEVMKNTFYLILAIIIIAGAVATICGVWYLNWNWAKNIFLITGKINDLDSFVMCCLVTIGLLFLELVVFSIACAIYEFFFYDLPLLLNLRYLPCTKEEILNFNFQSDEKFLEFVKSVCKKGDHYCIFKHMKREIAILFNLYLSAYQKDYNKKFLLDKDNELKIFLKDYI